MNFTGTELEEEVEAAFGKPTSEFTTREIWVIVKMIKHCRGRCRNNAALNNWLNHNFPGHRFVAVDKENKTTGETYKGLDIIQK